MIVFDASGADGRQREPGHRHDQTAHRRGAHAFSPIWLLNALHGFAALVSSPMALALTTNDNVELEFEPTPNAAERIMREVDGLTPAGRTPLTSAVEEAAECSTIAKARGVLVLLTDGEETCGRSPCDLGNNGCGPAAELTVHVISYRTEN